MEPSPDPSAGAPPGPTPDERPAGILVVDDNPTNVQILNAILRRQYEVHTASSGAEALAAAADPAIDLILLDVMMPDMDGYEVCRRLKADKQTREIPVIFVTAMSEVEDETRGFELGAVDYLTKPVSAPIVRARVRTHIELKRQRDLLRDLTAIDGLTGIANRRRFDQALDLEWRRAARNATTLSLLLIDIDDFKQYNDTYGHLAGDDCLRRVAATLKSSARRPPDLAARYGGEEFACLLPETDAEGAAQLGEMIRAKVEALAIEHRASRAGSVVTVSVGMAGLQPEHGRDPTELVEWADRALYEAKRQGRNRVVRLADAAVPAVG